MKSRNTYLKIMLMAAACLFTVGLVAQEEEGMLEEEVEELPPLYTSEIEFGVGYSSENSFKFGEYNGLEEEGFYGIGNILIRKNAVIGDGDNDYWELFGSNLGLNSRTIYGEYSHDGTYGEYSRNSAYRVFFEYDQLPHNRFGDAETPMIGAGTANQTLPASWVDIATSATTLYQFDIETERQKIGGGFSWAPLDGWKITANYHHELKEGALDTSAHYTYRSNSIVLAAPVDYNVDEFDLRIARVGEKGQFELGYHLSLFNNDDNALRWENPFVAAGGGDFAQMGLPPDNQSHQVSFAGGYNLGQTTRITGNFSYTRMEQDEAFLPYTINPATFGPGGAPLAPLPRTDLDGQIDKWFASAAISARPLRKLNLTGRYTFDYRDNQTPRDTYLYVALDRTGKRQCAIDGSCARINRPYGQEKHKAQLDAAYRFMPRTKLSASYEFELIDRTPDENLNEVDETREHTGKVKLLASPTDNTQVWVKYKHSERDGNDYDTPAPIVSGFSPEHLATLAPDEFFENNPYLRKYNQADRDRDRVAGNLSFFPNDKLTLGISGSYITDDYDDSVIGLSDRDNLNVTLDVSYIPSEAITTYAYFTYEYIDNEQNSFQYQHGPSLLPTDPMVPCVGCGGGGTDYEFWDMDTEDRVKTVGAGLEWNAMEDKLDVSLDYTYTDAETEMDLGAGPILQPVTGYPDVDTTIHSLSLRGDYKLNKNTSMRFSYLYEYFNTDDFGMDGLNAGDIGSTILMGVSSPDYNVHVVGLSLLYKF